ESGLRTSDGQIGWIQQKYLAYDSPIPIARYEEAQLILAEARGGQDAVDIINALRAPHGIPDYTGPTDAASIRNLIIEERRRELFVERSEEHTSELQSRENLVCRLLLEKKKEVNTITR